MALVKKQEEKGKNTVKPKLNFIKLKMLFPFLKNCLNNFIIYIQLCSSIVIFSFCNEIKRPPIESILLNSLLVVPGAGLERVGVVTSDF